jgi:hypothetical protein
MKKSIFTLFYPILFSIFILEFLVSCNDLRCIDGNNEMASQSRQLTEAFDGVDLSSDFTVFIKHGTTDSVIIEAESNLMSNILAEVKNHKLELKTSENTCLNPRKPVIIRVYTNKTETINITGSGNVQADSLISEELSITVSGSGSVKAPIYVEKLNAAIAGSGNVEIWGKASNCQLDISGSGNLESYGLDQDSCISSISGSGNMFVYVRKMLTASISGSGSVYYKGNPELNTQISGTGKVVNQQNSNSRAYSPRGSFNSFSSRSMYMIY